MFKELLQKRVGYKEISYMSVALILAYMIMQGSISNNSDEAALNLSLDIHESDLERKIAEEVNDV